MAHLSVSQRETIGVLRNWLREGKAQSASFQEIREVEKQFVPLQTDLSGRDAIQYCAVQLRIKRLVRLRAREVRDGFSKGRNDQDYSGATRR
jgi:hypothetical protein